MDVEAAPKQHLMLWDHEANKPSLDETKRLENKVSQVLVTA